MPPMQITEQQIDRLTEPTEIDALIAEASMELADIRVQIEREKSYRDSDSSYTRMRFDPATLERLTAQADEAEGILLTLEAKYTGWPRYFHVTNSNGHIHTSTSCSSCNALTQFAWRTDLSGLTEQQVVDREAYNACTVCMPIAPAEQRAAREHYNAQQRAERQSEKTAKANEKLAKAAARAVKFLAKVDAAVEQHCGSWDAFWTEYSTYGHDGRKSVYRLDVPQQVSDYLMDEKKQQEAAAEGRREARWHKDPKAIIAEAREKGLVA